MRILHALSQTELTGSEAYALDLCRYQTEQGHTCVVISDRLHLPFPGESLNLSLSTSSFFERMRNIWHLRHILKEKKIEVIHSHSRGACRHLYWASLGLRIPMLTSIHGYQHFSWSKRLLNIYGDYVLGVCENIRDQLRDQFGRKAYSLEVLRNPVNFSSSPDSSLPTTSPGCILLAGRSSGPKGRRLRELFTALEKSLLETSPHTHLHLVLSGLSRRELEELRARYPRPEIRIEGHLPGLRDTLQAASLVVCSGRIALEALALGKPVYALGEACHLGFVSDENLSRVLASNFGDVGPEETLRCDHIVAAIEAALPVRAPFLSPSGLEKLRYEFDFVRIQERILDLYRGLRLFKKARWIPILMYHKVVARPLKSQHRTFITAHQFERHLRFFCWRGLKSLDFRDLADFWYERRPLSEFPKRPVILTFDDGYRNNLEYASPLLKRYSHKCEIFLLADHAIQQNNWDPDEGDGSQALMDLEEKKSLPRSVYHIGSHGLTHRHYPMLSREELRREFRLSKERLESDLQTQINAFAYPFGAIDERLPELAREAGYDFAVNTDLGPVYWFTNPRSLFRANIFPEDGVFSLWKKTSTWYREYYFKKRGH